MLARGAGRVRRGSPSAISEAQLAGEKGAPRTSIARLADAARAPVHLDGTRARATTTGSCSPVVARARCRPRCVRDGPAAARARARRARRRVRPRPCARRAVGPRRSARPAPQRRARAGRAARRASRWSRPTTCTTPRPAQRPLAHRARRGARPPFARRDRRLAARPRRSRTCAARPSRQRRFARWPGAVERTVDIARACAFDLQARGARACPTTPCPTATPR